MGKEQYDCEVKDCKESWTHMIALLSEEEYSRDMVCATSPDRLFGVCDYHRRIYWNRIQREFNWETTTEPYSEHILDKNSR